MNDIITLNMFDSELGIELGIDRWSEKSLLKFNKIITPRKLKWALESLTLNNCKINFHRWENTNLILFFDKNSPENMREYYLKNENYRNYIHGLINEDLNLS